MCSGRYPTNVVCYMQFYWNGGDIEAARPATKLEFQNSQVTIALIMSPFLSATFIHPSPGTLRSVSHEEKVAEARARANMSGVIIKKSDGLTTQQIKQSFYPTQPTPASD